MTLKTFLNLVEIQTKTASQFPLFFGTLFAVYRYGKFNLPVFILMFISLLCFDMTTTAVNNYTDYKKSDDDDYKRRDNIIGAAGLSEPLVLLIIIVMFTAAVGSGVLLTIITGPVVLLIGGASFFVGIFYTFGPIPFSRMPLGEILSGFFMGFVIVFLSVYIHEPSIVDLQISFTEVILKVSPADIFGLAVVSAPFVFSISNLMLANNICDLDQDIKNDRFLLPYYIGIKGALKVFRWSYYLAYFSVAAAVALGILPLISLITLPGFIIVNKQLRIFLNRQSKAQTFITAVKNLTIISISNIIPLAIILLFRLARDVFYIH